jgi:hypothetical protein
MPDAITNTSPLVYLHRIEVLYWIPQIFSRVWVPQQILAELDEGRSRGYNVPTHEHLSWAEIVEPLHMPSEWFALDLGMGEVAAMALALENRERVVILDDLLARRTAHAAGLQVWGTLRILLEAKATGLTSEIRPHVEQLRASGMYLSPDVKQRILRLAGE